MAVKPGRLETSSEGAEAAMSVVTPVAAVGSRSAVGARPCMKAVAAAVPRSPGIPVMMGRKGTGEIIRGPCCPGLYALASPTLPVV